MPTATETTTIEAPPERVLEVLSDPAEATRWFPLPVELVDEPAATVGPGDAMRSRGELAGQPVEFDVVIDEVRDDGVRLVARGPLSCTVDSAVRAAADAPGTTELTVTLDVDAGGGMGGSMLAQAARPLVAPWLRQALASIRERAEG